MSRVKRQTADRLFEAIVHSYSGHPKVTKSRMFGSEGLKIDGKVFAVLVKGKLVLKLSKERVDELVAAKNGRRFDPGMGRVMKEWVALEPGTEAKWLSLAEEARRFVAAGRPESDGGPARR